MKEILTEIDNIAKKIGSFENKRKEVSIEIKESLKGCKLGVGENLTNSIEKTGLNDIRIGGTDGGLVKKSYQGLDLILVRAVSAIFSYKDNKLEDVDYIPGVSPTPELKIYDNLQSKTDFSKAANISRLFRETETILETLKGKSDLVLADGSILPHPSDVPKRKSPVYRDFKKLLSKYEELYKLSGETQFAGVCEDSRARKFVRLIEGELEISDKNELIKRSRDISLLNYMLKKGERSFVFRYSKNPKQNPILNKLKGYGENIYSFYMKNTHYDLPVRVDFYSEENPIKTAGKISSMIFNISSDNEEYGLPTVLIEADRRAKISKNELEMIHSSIKDRCGDLPNLRDLNRRNRPF
ncbi:MAG: DNA double-strand break repair nuclease NurA [Candidatus Aenigmatarchaeota archaeon]